MADKNAPLLHRSSAAPFNDNDTLAWKKRKEVEKRQIEQAGTFAAPTQSGSQIMTKLSHLQQLIRDQEPQTLPDFNNTWRELVDLAVDPATHEVTNTRLLEVLTHIRAAALTSFYTQRFSHLPGHQTLDFSTNFHALQRKHSDSPLDEEVWGNLQLGFLRPQYMTMQLHDPEKHGAFPLFPDMHLQHNFNNATTPPSSGKRANISGESRQAMKRNPS
jgi:hypothetical protein